MKLYWQQLKLTANSIAASIACGLIFANAAMATMDGEQLAKELEEANILEKGYKISAQIADSKATLSTYLNMAAKDPFKDCKIDALLLAKKAFALDDALAVVNVRFVSQTSGRYGEVEVRAGDVAAFTAGKIDKEKLLQELEVVVHQPNGQVESATVARVDAAATTAAAAAGKQHPGESLENVLGICFYSPRDWVRKQQGIVRDGEDEWRLCELFCRTNPAYTICLKRHEQKMVEKVIKDNEEWWNGNGYTFRAPVHGTIGATRALPCATMTVKEGGGDALEEIVFFSYGSKVYSFEMDTDASGWHQSSLALNSILSSLYFLR